MEAYLGLRVIRKEVEDVVDKIDKDILALEEKRKCIIAAKSTKSSITEECFREALRSIVKRVPYSSFKSISIGCKLPNGYFSNTRPQIEFYPSVI